MFCQQPLRTCEKYDNDRDLWIVTKPMSVARAGYYFLFWLLLIKLMLNILYIYHIYVLGLSLVFPNQIHDISL